MGSDVGYGLLNPALAVEIGYMLGVCLQQTTLCRPVATNKTLSLVIIFTIG